MAGKGKAPISSNKESFSWSWHLDKLDADVLNPVRDQQECSCCYAVAACGACEALSKLEHGRKIQLSIQEIANCIHEKFPLPSNKTPKVDRVGCELSSISKAFKYIQQYGVSLEENYKYMAKKGPCNPPHDGAKLRISSFSKVDDKDAARHEKIIRLIKDRPICAAIPVHESYLGIQDDVIYQGRQSSEDRYKGKHAVLLIGYGTENGVDFYWFQSSHGTDWGANGYGRVQRNLVTRCSYPVNIEWVE